MTTLFGPVLWYDMVRSSRRISIVLLRCLYPFLLFSVLAATNSDFLERNFFSSQDINPNELAIVSHAFFTIFMIIQWIAVFVLTPIYVGSAIADEKDRRTLEYIFTTDLRNREIVLGKLMSRLAVLMLILLAGLPLLSIMQLLGGVSPDLLWSGFAATALTMLSLSGISMYWSVHCRNSREAILLTFLTIVLYFVIYSVALVLWWMIFGRPVRFPELDSLDWEAALGLGVWGLASGNPFHAIFDLANAAGTAGGRGYGGVLIVWLVRYAVFHGLSFVLFISLAILQVRSAYIRQTYGGAKRTRLPAGAAASRFRVKMGNRPMIWKELLTDGGHPPSKAAKILSGLLALVVLFFTGAFLIVRLGLDDNLVVFVTVILLGPLMASFLSLILTRGLSRIVWIAVCTLIVGLVLFIVTVDSACSTWWRWNWNRVTLWDELLRVFLTLYAALIWFAASIRAAYSINVERERQTLDVLLSTPLTERDIIGAKWIGSLLYARWLIGVLLIVWFLVMCGGLLHPIGLLASVATFAIYLGFFTSVGLLCGTLVRSSLLAGLLTSLVCLFLMGAHFFVSVPIMTVIVEEYGSRSSSRVIVAAFFTTTPTVVMGFAQMNGWELERPTNYLPDDELRFWIIIFSILWTLGWVLLGYLLYEKAVRGFRARCGRITLTKPRSPRYSVLTASASHAMVAKRVQANSS